MSNKKGLREEAIQVFSILLSYETQRIYWKVILQNLRHILEQWQVTQRPSTVWLSDFIACDMDFSIVSLMLVNCLTTEWLWSVTVAITEAVAKRHSLKKSNTKICKSHSKITATKPFYSKGCKVFPATCWEKHSMAGAFQVNFAKVWKTAIPWNVFERLLLNNFSKVNFFCFKIMIFTTIFFLLSLFK